MKFVHGRRVQITFDGRCVPGEICLESRDGLSLVLMFEDSLGPYESVMPVLWIEGSYVDLLHGNHVGLTGPDMVEKGRD